MEVTVKKFYNTSLRTSYALDREVWTFKFEVVRLYNYGEFTELDWVSDKVSQCDLNGGSNPF